jgi:hypothetical protein
MRRLGLYGVGARRSLFLARWFYSSAGRNAAMREVIFLVWFFLVIGTGASSVTQVGPFADETACNNYRNSVTLSSYACFSTTAK